MAGRPLPEAPPPTTADALASGRRSAWAEVGKEVGLSLRDDALVLEGALEEVEVTVRTDVREGATKLVAELRWEPWGLHLSIGPRQIYDGRYEIFLDAFNQRFVVRGRDTAQLGAALDFDLRAALLAFDDVELDDAHATVRSSSPGHQKPGIGAFVAKVATLAAALQAASRRIPPPALMAARLPAWRAFAAQLGGRLRVGPMRLVDLPLDGARFEIETTFDRHGVPERNVVRLVLDPPLPAPFDPRDADDMARAPRAARPLIASLRERGLVVEKQAMTVRFPLLDDPAPVRRTMGEMLALASALRGERRTGPYR